ncbi:MAG: DUF1987 domain-containing protein [Bacteroidales bacterium]|nr:DUF1987 domain-containing protein [Bacteroidales bacterium]
MAALKIEPGDDTPMVILDKEHNKFEISGKSMPADVRSFYQPVLDWVSAYTDDPLDKTIFDFKLIYFNTSSSKIFLDIFMMLEELSEAGKEVLVRWHSAEPDEDMQDAGEEYAEMTELQFEFHTYEF